jgi:hypothetical protein
LDFKDRKKTESSVSDNGTIVLSWEKPDTTEVEIQQSSDQSFGEAITRYKGMDSGSVITGLPEGTHYFRISEQPDGEWSKPLEVKVVFFPRSQLFLILGIGGFVVLATIGTIVIGHFNTKREVEE